MDDYRKTEWNQVLDDYLELYLEERGLEDLPPEDLDSYPQESIPNETEFWLRKKEVDREIEKLLEAQEEVEKDH